MKITKLTLWESIKMEYYILKFLITDKYEQELERLFKKKYNLEDKEY